MSYLLDGLDERDRRAILENLDESDGAQRQQGQQSVNRQSASSAQGGRTPAGDRRDPITGSPVPPTPAITVRLPFPVSPDDVCAALPLLPGKLGSTATAGQRGALDLTRARFLPDKSAETSRT